MIERNTRNRKICYIELRMCVKKSKLFEKYEDWIYF